MFLESYFDDDCCDYHNTQAAQNQLVPGCKRFCLRRFPRQLLELAGLLTLKMVVVPIID
jgi:hypothetical protein